MPVRLSRWRSDAFQVSAVIADADDHAARQFVEFFTAHGRNPNMRRSEKGDRRNCRRT